MVMKETAIYFPDKRRIYCCFPLRALELAGMDSRNLWTGMPDMRAPSSGKRGRVKRREKKYSRTDFFFGERSSCREWQVVFRFILQVRDLRN